MSETTDFNKLLNDIKEDAGLIDNLTDDQIIELRKKINPYGRTIQGQKTLTCLSITNLQEQYMKRFLMTGLISFLYRKCDEYDLDDGEPVESMDDGKTFMIKYNNAIKEAQKAVLYVEDFEKSEIKEDSLDFKQKSELLKNKRSIERGLGFKKRLIIRQFLDDNFSFNPDKHVKSAYSDNPLDPERNMPSKLAVDSSLTKKYNDSHAANHIPPVDVFHRWNYFLDTNYEEIRCAVKDLYCEKPDLEFAVLPYDQFDTEEDAKKFVQKHKKEVIADILTLHNSKWNLMGSFKKNRERINFYNEKTSVVEQIFKQIETDKKVGAELMRKRVKRKKVKNKEEYGPEVPKMFDEYSKLKAGDMEMLGAENLSKEREKELLKEGKTYLSNPNHEDCPFDSVQVDVFDFRKGGDNVKKSEFFTKAEVKDPESGLVN